MDASLSLLVLVVPPLSLSKFLSFHPQAAVPANNQVEDARGILREAEETTLVSALVSASLPSLSQERFVPALQAASVMGIILLSRHPYPPLPPPALLKSHAFCSPWVHRPSVISAVASSKARHRGVANRST